MGKERAKVNAERQRQRFRREFKLEAVSVLEPGQKPAARLALKENEAKHLMDELNFGDAASQDIHGAIQYLKGLGSGKIGSTGFRSVGFSVLCRSFRLI